MAYVDGFLLPLPKDKVQAYREMATKSGNVWIEHGALSYVECIADDVKPGKINSFPQSVLQEDGETVVFAWITYESRARRDEVNEKVMADPRLKEMMDPSKMPFDGKRMMYGGFEVLVDINDDIGKQARAAR